MCYSVFADLLLGLACLSRVCHCRSLGLGTTESSIENTESWTDSSTVLDTFSDFTADFTSDFSTTEATVVTENSEFTTIFDGKTDLTTAEQDNTHNSLNGESSTVSSPTSSSASTTQVSTTSQEQEQSQSKLKQSQSMAANQQSQHSVIALVENYQRKAQEAFETQCKNYHIFQSINGSNFTTCEEYADALYLATIQHPSPPFHLPAAISNNHPDKAVSAHYFYFQNVTILQFA